MSGRGECVSELMTGPEWATFLAVRPTQCVCERDSVCVCLCVRERETDRETDREKERRYSPPIV